MAITQPFDENSEQYEQWFVTNRWVYDTEVEAIRDVLPSTGTAGNASPAGLEIGAGSGLFASRLGIANGVEPSSAMIEKARVRGLDMKEGVAESLPYPDESFDYTLMVTAICFLDDMEQSVNEIRRVLKTGGSAVFGFVDKDSPLGRLYQEHKHENVFYARATFRSASEVLDVLRRKGFTIELVRQTVFGSLEEIRSIQPSEEGHGRGGFVVIKAVK
jgi:SAM-dependent methyltransferase